MRSAPTLVALSFALTLVAFAPAIQARAIACSDLADLGCGTSACSMAVGGDPCPQADVPAICKDLAVGPREPARVTVHYGTGTGCFGATLTTCHLQHDPSEPSTPVWVCDDTRLP